MSKQKPLSKFFESLVKEDKYCSNIQQAFFDEVLNDDEVFAQKKSSLETIRKLYKSSVTGKDVATRLVESDHYKLWKQVQLVEHDTVLVEAENSESAYKIGFIICSKCRPDEAGFVLNELDGHFEAHPKTVEISEEDIKTLGLDENSPEERFREPIFLLSFWWDEME
jgi:hypothetical protein